MTISPQRAAGHAASHAAAPQAAAPRSRGTSPDEAARQFEAVLVRQFVEVMTKDLFDGEGEGMMTGQADLQRDTMTDVLTDHLVEAGTFGIADLLTAQWGREGASPAADLPAGPRPLKLSAADR